MPLDIPQSNQLTDIQSEVVTKIGSIKNLLALPRKANVNIPKDQQISTYDYLVRVLSAFGLTPEQLINQFLTLVFDEAGELLEEKVIKAMADSLGERGISLPNINNQNATPGEKEQYKEQNLQFLTGLIPATFLQTFKQRMAKDLIILIFGGQDTDAAAALNPSASDRERIVQEAICGLGLFSVSSDSFIRDEELEFNRIKLKKELEQGSVEYEISCQKVKVSLPDDPLQFFEGGGTSQIPGGGVTPARSLQLIAEYVGGQVSNINRESNSNSSEKTFIETMAMKLIEFISTIVFPYLAGAWSLISQTSATAGLTLEDMVPSYCDIMNNPDDKATKEFARSLSNSLLKELLKIILVFVIKELKDLVLNYFAETAIRALRRKLEKQKEKFKIFDQAQDEASKASRFSSAIQSLGSILD
jgi:hypothetical protein